MVCNTLLDIIYGGTCSMITCVTLRLDHELDSFSYCLTSLLNQNVSSFLWMLYGFYSWCLSFWAVLFIENVRTRGIQLLYWQFVMDNNWWRFKGGISEIWPSYQGKGDMLQNPSLSLPGSCKICLFFLHSPHHIFFGDCLLT